MTNKSLRDNSYRLECSMWDSLLHMFLQDTDCNHKLQRWNRFQHGTKHMCWKKPLQSQQRKNRWDNYSRQSHSDHRELSNTFLYHSSGIELTPALKRRYPLDTDYKKMPQMSQSRNQPHTTGRPPNSAIQSLSKICPGCS